MQDLITFTFRIPKELARSVEVAARRLGVSKSEYGRRALEEFEHRLMQDRIAELSRALAVQSGAAADSMEDSTNDGLR